MQSKLFLINIIITQIFYDIMQYKYKPLGFFLLENISFKRIKIE